MVSEVAWTAHMIAPLADRGPTHSAFVASVFDCADPTGAELHITAQGVYVAFLNGVRVGRDLMTPGWTTYDTRHPFQSYDVSDMLRRGSNRLEIWLADGWWRSSLLWNGSPVDSCWGNHIAALAQIDGPDGVVVSTGADWVSGATPVCMSGLYPGEIYDARIDIEDSHGVTVLDFNRSLLVQHEIEPVRELSPLASVETWIDREGRTVLDFGQNCAAVVRLSLKGRAGDRVIVENAETLGPDRAWDNSNLRGAEAITDYTLRDGEQVYQPLFTFMGFRYVRITVIGDVEISAAHSIPVTSISARRSSFHCANALVEKLVDNTLWSLRSNFIEVPTDCPQRDERLGWTGDAQVFAGTACWLADSHAFWRKYLRDMMADQRPDGAIAHFSPDPSRQKPLEGLDWAGSTGWGDAITIIPWQLYLHYGDKDILGECFPAMIRWIDYLWSLSEGPIIYPQPVLGKRGFTFGDWLQPGGDGCKSVPTIGDDCAATIYHFVSTDLCARVATILGHEDQAESLRQRSDEIRRAFAREFITGSGRLAYGDQTSYCLALLHGLVPDEHLQAAKDHFSRILEQAEGRLSTGFIGTPALLPALGAAGLHDLAGKVLLNEEVPGWLYQVKLGATTIWERWDALAADGTIHAPEMNSYNHYAYGAVCQWLFEGVAGLRPDPELPGFEGLILDPVIIPSLSPVSASHESAKGLIEAAWRCEEGLVRYTVTLPQGCQARLGTRALERLMRSDNKILKDVRLGPGRHELEFALE